VVIPGDDSLENGAVTGADRANGDEERNFYFSSYPPRTAHAKYAAAIKYIKRSRNTEIK